MDPPASASSALARILELPEEWHGAGSLSEPVLRTLARHAAALDIVNSVETGAGKSTLLLSHFSKRHTVFALDGGSSLSMTADSTLLRREVVEFVEGPTQWTLPRHEFRERLQLVFLDGPHGFPFSALEYYYLYPHLDPGGLLVVDDIQIPAVNDLFRFLKADDMFELLDVVRSTAFLRRTDHPTFDPLGDGWDLQGYNRRIRFVPSRTGIVRPLIPESLYTPVRAFLSARGWWK